MIATKLVGGLGNQMFQYAVGKRLAMQHDTELVLDRSWYDQIDAADTNRHYELDCFAFKPIFPATQTYVRVVPNETETLKTKLYSLTKGRSKPRLLPYIEKSHGFDPDVLSLPNNTLLEGFWQTEKYFKDIRPQILKDFALAKKASGKNAELLREINAVNAISLHVRRGDYVSNKNAASFHGLAGLDYYKQAVKAIAKESKDSHVYVFSDDPAWCQKNLKLSQPTTYVSHNTDGSEDMRLMAACKHHIIANSTFSWWGAWLNPSTKKIVYAPKQWFLDTSINTNDVVPANWRRL